MKKAAKKSASAAKRRPVAKKKAVATKKAAATKSVATRAAAKKTPPAKRKKKAATARKKRTATATGAEKIATLGIPRDEATNYAVFDGNVYSQPKDPNDSTNIIFMSFDRDDYTLIRETGVAPEPGYIYFLDEDGDLARESVFPR